MKLKAILDLDFSEHPVLNRHEGVRKILREHFSPEDDLIILRAPGRINLIGEHTDYNMGTVLPASIDREIVLFISRGNDGGVTWYNADQKYPAVKFNLHSEMKKDAPGVWSNYLKAGILGVLAYHRQNNRNRGKPLKGLTAVVSGCLPAAAGLSSSSALVVASALALLIVNKIALPAGKLAEICAKAEYFVGTAGGGMDQAACLLGKAHHFLHIRFEPLAASAIPAPRNLRLILCHSGVYAEKSGQAREAYNQRVLECRLAMALFNRFLVQTECSVKEKLEYIGQITPENLSLSVSEMDNLVSAFLSQLPENIVWRKLLWEQPYLRDAATEWPHIDKISEETVLNLKHRFKYVYQECRRVEQAVSYLKIGDLNALGALLNQTHQGLRDHYQVSHPAADRLVDILQNAGALGARIMGAGFGGMVLALCTPQTQTQIIETVCAEFYGGSGPDERIITCTPDDGAGLIEF